MSDKSGGKFATLMVLLVVILAVFGWLLATQVQIKEPNQADRREGRVLGRVAGSPGSVNVLVLGSDGSEGVARARDPYSVETSLVAGDTVVLVKPDTEGGPVGIELSLGSADSSDATAVAVLAERKRERAEADAAAAEALVPYAVRWGDMGSTGDTAR